MRQGPRGVLCQHTYVPPLSPRPSSGAISSIVSPGRFQPYLDAAGQDVELAVELYEWNIVLSAAFWEVIALLEVAVRNAMNDQLTAAYGPRWYEDSTILDDRSRAAVREAKRRASRGVPPATALSPGKVVSEMSFGVWVALLDQGGQSTAQGRRLRYHDTLWTPGLQHAFPAGLGHQRKTNRGLRTVQSLRNRIGHHEKIFSEPFKDSGLSLAALHDHCLDVGGWVSSDARAWMAAVSRVPITLGVRPPGT